MNDIPTKVFVVMGVEIGMFVGWGIILGFTLRSVVKVTREERWLSMSYIDNVSYRRK